MDRSLAALEDSEPAFACRRLFPQGEVTFITDNVLVNHPQQATEVIDGFLYSVRTKQLGVEINRIAARPGVKEWMFQLALKSVEECGRPDTRYMHLYEAVCKLCPPQDEDPLDPPNPLPTSSLISISPEELPSFEDMWAEDQERATDYMISWFAGWSISNAAKYRRFSVCYQPDDRSGPASSQVAMDANGKMAKVEKNADTRGWLKEYQHLANVTPDEWLERQKKV